MAGYSIIADISQYIANLLRKHLCPTYMTSPDMIKLVSPVDKNADYQLGIFLYDIQGLGEAFTIPMASMASRGHKTNPPQPLKLKYMIYISNKAQIAAKGEDEQRILGLVMQLLYDNPVIEIQKIHQFSESFDTTSTLSLINMPLEEKSKIWTGLGLPIQLGIYLEVSPILLSSTQREEVQRVVATQFNVEEIR